MNDVIYIRHLILLLKANTSLQALTAGESEMLTYLLFRLVNPFALQLMLKVLIWLNDLIPLFLPSYFCMTHGGAYDQIWSCHAMAVWVHNLYGSLSRAINLRLTKISCILFYIYLFIYSIIAHFLLMITIFDKSILLP